MLDDDHGKAGHHHGNHGHSHDNIDVPTGAGCQVSVRLHVSTDNWQLIIVPLFQAASRGFLVVLALSIHDLFEGVWITCLLIQD